jgi:DNA-binding HxlR family transcriptional regulator
MVEATKSLTNRGTLRIASILRAAPARLGEIERALSAIGAPRTLLAVDLKRMIRDGLITKEIAHIGPPARIVYALTPLGRDFADYASNLMAFIDRHQAGIEGARQRAHDANEVDRAAALIAQNVA